VLAVTAVSFDEQNPIAGLAIGERPDPVAPDGWALVRVKASALNHHDVWSLRGVGLDSSVLPMILGCDGAGIDDAGNEVVIHAVIGDPAAGFGDESLDPRRSLVSERHNGTFAEYVAVPRGNLIPKPAALSWEEAACLPTSWLTAYRMLFSNSGCRPGDTVLIQGAGGGVATAAICLARAAGFRTWVTSRSDDKLERARALGAHDVFESGQRLPERVDAVIETVGAATFEHSLKCLRPGGSLVIAGATSGGVTSIDLARVFFLQLRVVGSTMGNISELRRLAKFLDETTVRPPIDTVLPLDQASSGFERMIEGDVFGKVVFRHEAE
jgi:NADPH:quinone reductase-like Zn-dependent oxidoreductase